KRRSPISGSCRNRGSNALWSLLRLSGRGHVGCALCSWYEKHLADVAPISDSVMRKRRFAKLERLRDLRFDRTLFPQVE
ncbi:MAG: hypothetical protein WAK35_13590, partial [Xanthobacteraceae bacterium]